MNPRITNIYVKYDTIEPTASTVRSIPISGTIRARKLEQNR